MAIAVYFLLTALGLNRLHAIYTLAAVSFSVGLVTEEEIQTLTTFTREKLANNGSLTENTKTTQKH